MEFSAKARLGTVFPFKDVRRAQKWLQGVGETQSGPVVSCKDVRIAQLLQLVAKRLSKDRPIA